MCLKHLKRSTQRASTSYLAPLQMLELFELLEEHELLAVAQLMHLRSYDHQENVFREHEPAQALYILEEGTIQTSINHLEKTEELCPITNTAAFGYEAIFINSKRIYNATISSQEATIYGIASVHLRELFSNHAQIKAKIMHNLSKIYKQYIEEIFNYYNQNTGFFELSQIKHHC